MKQLKVTIETLGIMIAGAVLMLLVFTAGTAAGEAAATGSGSATTVPALSSGSGLGGAMVPAAALPIVGAGSGSAVAVVIVPPDIEADPGGFFAMLWRGASDGAWKIVAGLVLVGLVYVVRRWVVGWIAWTKTTAGGYTVAISTAIASTIGLAMLADAPIDFEALGTAIGTALAGMGLWETGKDLALAEKAHKAKAAKAEAPPT